VAEEPAFVRDHLEGTLPKSPLLHGRFVKFDVIVWDAKPTPEIRVYRREDVPPILPMRRVPRSATSRTQSKRTAGSCPNCGARWAASRWRSS